MSLRDPIDVQHVDFARLAHSLQVDSYWAQCMAYIDRGQGGEIKWQIKAMLLVIEELRHQVEVQKAAHKKDLEALITEIQSPQIWDHEYDGDDYSSWTICNGRWALEGQIEEMLKEVDHAKE